MSRFLIIFGLLWICGGSALRASHIKVCDQSEVGNYAFAKADTLSTSNSIVQEDIAEDTIPLRYDNRNINAKEFDNDLTDKYTGDDFDYTERELGSQNLILGIFSYILRVIADIFDIAMAPWLAKLLEIIFYICLGLGALYFVLKTYRGSGSDRVLGKTATKIKAVVTGNYEETRPDHSLLANEAAAQGDFRLAVRHLYLKALNGLEDRGLITRHADKTNVDYQLELAGSGLENFYREASYIYDHIWYGEFPVDSSDYDRARSRFSMLFKSMSR